MELHELINLVACLIFLGWLLLIAERMPSRGHLLAQVVTVWLAVMAGWQAIGPFFQAMDQVTWSTALFHGMAAFASLLCRRQIVSFLDICFPPKSRPARRAIDPKGRSA